MTKLDLLLERIRLLPQDRQDAVGANCILLDDEESGSVLSDEPWARVKNTLDEDEEEIPHEQVVAEFRQKFRG